MQELIKYLLDTCESLVLNEMQWSDKNAKVINGVFKKIEKKKSDTLTRHEKEVLSEFFDIRFTNGKIAGYIFVIQQLSGGQFTIPEAYPALRSWVAAKMK